MTTVLLILHLFVTLALIGTVLIQRSEGGGLGIGSSQGMGSFMSGRGTANLLTRTTAVLAACFMLLSLVLAILNRGTSGVGHDILAEPAPKGVTLNGPATAPVTQAGKQGGMAPVAPPAGPAPTSPTASPAVPNQPPVVPTH